MMYIFSPTAPILNGPDADSDASPHPENSSSGNHLGKKQGEITSTRMFWGTAYP